METKHESNAINLLSGLEYDVQIREIAIEFGGRSRDSKQREIESKLFFHGKGRNSWILLRLPSTQRNGVKRESLTKIPSWFFKEEEIRRTFWKESFLSWEASGGQIPDHDSRKRQVVKFTPNTQNYFKDIFLYYKNLNKLAIK